MSAVIVDPRALQRFVQQVYERAGVPSADAALVADSLVQADLWGHQSHGVLRMSWYFRRLRSGAMRPVTSIATVRDRPGVAVLDGADGIGQVIAAQAMHLAIRKAKAQGLASVAVRHSNHFGTLMYFTRMAAQAGCVAFLATNGGPAMAPWGGAKRKVVGNNPWSIAAPAPGRAPIVLDIANTGVARGKIYLARQRGEPIPAGWALDAAGEPTTDPQAAIDGLILPMGQHKGYAIAALMDVLAGVLSGSQFLSGVASPFHFDRRSGAGHFLTVHDIEAFLPRAEYDQRIEAFIGELKSAPLAPGGDAIRYPGEVEAEAAERHSREGLRLPADTWSDLGVIAGETGTLSLLQACRQDGATP